VRLSRKEKRKAQIKELSRQSILKFAPAPITPQELHDHKWILTMRPLIKHARYRKPPKMWTVVNKLKLTSKPLKTVIIKIGST
jgi:hypothetical protein